LEKCPKCNSEQPLDVDKCSSCGGYLGAPNVRIISAQEEREALNKRYNDAKCNIKDKDIDFEIELFERNIQEHSRAVINVDIDLMKYILTKDKALYSNYNLRVHSHVCKPAEDSNDRKRISADSILFGWYGDQIIYAALSSSKKGLTNYGNYSLILKEISVSDRATLIEENSYKFIEKYDLFRNPSIPLGFRSIWQDRYKLVLIKHINNIKKGHTIEEFNNMLLVSGTDRSKDEFVEIHIYGTFDCHAIEEISESDSIKPLDEQIILDNLKQKCEHQGITWNRI
jgi:hypothetical protein